MERSLRHMNRYIVIVLIALASCSGRQAASHRPDPAAVEEAWLQEHFLDAPFVITRQEQLDSLLEVFNRIIATDPSPEAYLHRLSLFAAGEQWEKALQDAEKALTLLPPGDTSELSMRFHLAKACYSGKLGRSEKSDAEYHWIMEHGNDAEVLEAKVALGIIPETEAVLQ